MLAAVVGARRFGALPLGLRHRRSPLQPPGLVLMGQGVKSLYHGGILRRLPAPEEFPQAAAVVEQFGSLKRAFALVRRVTGEAE